MKMSVPHSTTPPTAAALASNSELFAATVKIADALVALCDELGCGTAGNHVSLGSELLRAELKRRHGLALAS